MQKRPATMPAVIPKLAMVVGMFVAIGCHWDAFRLIRAGQYSIMARGRIIEVVRAADQPWDLWVMIVVMFVFPLVWRTPWVVLLVAARRSGKRRGQPGVG
jgi:hypothetical protein